MLQTLDSLPQPAQPRELAFPSMSFRRHVAPAVSRQAIEEAVVQVFGVACEDLRCVTRGHARAAHARQVAMYLAHVACGLSLTDTGKLFGRDRTTVAHACGMVEDRRDDPVFDRALDLLGWAVPVLVTRSSAPSSFRL